MGAGRFGRPFKWHLVKSALKILEISVREDDG